MSEILEFPCIESSLDKISLSKDKKDEKITIQLFKENNLIGSQEVTFSLNNGKKKNNNTFKKWVSFNIQNDVNTTNITNIDVNNKIKNNKKKSLTGLLKFSEFFKILLLISIPNESDLLAHQKKLTSENSAIESIKNDVCKVKENEKTDKNLKTEVYINIQENYENDAFNHMDKFTGKLLDNNLSNEKYNKENTLENNVIVNEKIKAKTEHRNGSSGKNNVSKLNNKFYKKSKTNNNSITIENHFEVLESNTSISNLFKIDFFISISLIYCNIIIIKLYL